MVERKLEGHGAAEGVATQQKAPALQLVREAEEPAHRGIRTVRLRIFRSLGISMTKEVSRHDAEVLAQAFDVGHERRLAGREAVDEHQRGAARRSVNEGVGDAAAEFSVEGHNGSVGRGRVSRKTLPGTIRAMKLEYAIVADHAEIVHNRLFLMGGGRDVFNADNVPALLRMAIAVGVRIDWEETNQAHELTVTVDDEDGKQLARIQANVNVGRPAGLPPGSSQLAQFATALPLRVTEFGGYRVGIAAGEGPDAITHAIPFRVARTPGQGRQRGQPPPSQS